MPDVTPPKVELDSMAKENLESILWYLQTQEGGGNLGIGFEPSTNEWVVMTVFGKEADDSDMAGGAAQSSHDDLRVAIFEVANQMGLAE